MGIGSIQAKITFWSGCCLIFTAAMIISYSAISLRDRTIQETRAKAMSLAQQSAFEVKLELEQALDTARTVATLFQAHKQTDNQFELTRDQANAILQNILIENPQFMGVYTGWEPYAFDSKDDLFLDAPGHDLTGRFVPYWSRSKAGQLVVQPLYRYDMAGDGDYYQIPQKKLNEAIIDPNPYPIGDEKILITSLVVPILDGGRFVGISGVDYSLDFLQEVADNILRLYPSGKILLVSNNGTIAAATDRPQLAGKQFNEFFMDFTRLQPNQSEMTATDLRLRVPVFLGRTNTPWSLYVTMPAAVVTREATMVMYPMLAISLALTLAALLVLYLLSGQIAKPISRVIKVTKTITRGDLFSAKMELEELAGQIGGETEAGKAGARALIERDETGQLIFAVGNMVDALNALATEVQRSGGKVSLSTAQIASSALQMEATANDQLNSTNDVVQITREISTISKELVRTMNEVSLVSTDTADLADTALRDLGEMEQAITLLRDATDSISAKLSIISEKADNINVVTTTINKIADQTNLLSLNAAIEAEKAGEYGLGFSVVAREIRRLADQTAVASLDIEKMANEMYTAVTAGVEEMTRFTDEVSHNVEYTRRTGADLEKIIARVKALSPRYHQVNAGMESQANRAAQINEMMINLNDNTKQTYDSIHEFKTAAEQLDQAAQNLQDEVGRFKVQSQSNSGRFYAKQINIR